MKRRRKLKSIVEEDDPSRLLIGLDEKTTVEILHEEFKKIKDSSDKVRRGVFAKHSSLAKKIEELSCQINDVQFQMMHLGNWVTFAMNVLSRMDMKLSQDIFLQFTLECAPFAIAQSHSDPQETTEKVTDLLAVNS